MSAHVEIPRPYESAPGRFTVDLVFPAQSKRRATEHHDVAWALADVHGLEASTPYKVNPRWSVYEENWGNKERHGWQDMRRLTVQGPARELARYLVALERVVEAVEALATRAVRVFGAWKRSVAAEAHVEYEDASTLRVRARGFRADVLHALVRGLGARRRPAGERDTSRPLWEQYGAVAGEVWEAAGGVDLERADDSAVAALMARMVPAVVAEAERLAVLEAARVERERLEEERAELFQRAEAAGAREAAEADAERYARDGQGALFAVAEARPPLVVPPPIPVKPRRAPRKRVPVAARFPEGTTHIAISREQVEHFHPGMAAAVWPQVSAERRRYAAAA
ncbi:hypothetical protein ACIP93_33600 [Streptomyces sp. NPDC088745]|uniref:hypothetical protein n=1 Tax=Streptomyces sp. NPDC088745 TaxID=3365884 RepID=UPI0038194624